MRQLVERLNVRGGGLRASDSRQTDRTCEVGNRYIGIVRWFPGKAAWLPRLQVCRCLPVTPLERISCRQCSEGVGRRMPIRLAVRRLQFLGIFENAAHSIVIGHLQIRVGEVVQRVRIVEIDFT
jgi:hypothetical protein